ncbi:MAG: MFS transporter [Candidatus Thermoplasmatota archaeon]|nr:MFS transporter [Candidatus Thermoplasmatota archaeon]
MSRPPSQTSSLSMEERRNRAATIAIVMAGLTMSAIDTTAVVLGLPTMKTDLHSDYITMIWVIMAYLLIMTVATTQVGRLGDMFGRVRMYNLGFALFTVFSLLSGFSQTDIELILFRTLQGLGGAFIFANSGAILADTFPPNERGRAFGYTGIGFSMGAIFGVLVGGAFVTFLSWRYIFFINVPIGTAATILGYYLLKDKSPRLREKMDYPGVVLLGFGLFAALYGITNITGSGWKELYGLEILSGLLLIAGFLFLESKAKSPLLDLSLLKNRVLSASIFAAFFQSLATYAVLFLVIMYLQGPRALTPWSSSILLIPGYILGGAVAPLSGRLSDRIGARVVATIGLSVQILGILVYLTYSLSTSLYVVILGAVIYGSGNSAFFAPNNSAVMASAPPRSYGVTNGLLRTLSNMGMVSSFAIALLLASVSIPRAFAFQIFLGVGKISGQLATAYITGMHTALEATIILLIVAIILSLLRGKEARTMRRPTNKENTSKTG